jgi:DNA polymerase-3 subunit epsilon
MESYPAGFAFVDVETTGFSPKYDRVVEVAVVRTDDCMRILAEMTTLINPERRVDATDVHGISNRHVARAPKFGQMVGVIARHLSGAVIVGHNISFDLGFLQYEFQRAKAIFPAKVVLCTMRLADTYLPGLNRHRLGDCCRAAGVIQDGAHQALSDARATCALFECYFRKSKARTATPFANELKRASKLKWPVQEGVVSLCPRGHAASKPRA